MKGVVQGRKPIQTVVIRLSGHPDLAIDFVIDTGFEGELTLPLSAVSALGLPLVGSVFTRVADGHRSQVNFYEATILWMGSERVIQVLAMGSVPLLGTVLLQDHDLVIRFRDGGDVSILPCP